MKKKILLVLLVLIGLFTISGCTKNNKNNDKDNNKEESKSTVAFTKEVVRENSHVKYKIPEEGDMFRDMGHSCQVSHYTNQTSVMALYPFDDKVDKIDKVTINGFTYETYKYVDNLGTTYVYRTKINNDYHLFQYYCVNKNYDDSKPVEFMNTVEYIYDQINSKFE